MNESRVLLISRLTTQNAGNEALSKELIDYARGCLPSADLRALDRYPRYFEQFRLDKLGDDPCPAFDTIARRLMSKFLSLGVPLPRLADSNMVKLDETGRELTGAMRKLKRRVAVRRRLAALGVIEGDATSIAVNACASSDLVIWNPAGEIQPTAASSDHVVRLLLLLRIAQLAGRKTAVINHSLELGNDRLKKLVAHVYTRLDYVGLRDAHSVAAARGLGVQGPRIFEAPDLVFLASRRLSTAAASKRNGAIGLAVNGLEALAGTDEWQILIEGLKRFKRPFLFVSNAMNHDLDFARHLARIAGEGEVIDHQPGYLELRSYYRGCDVLVSSRLHASILALCENVPVVSIEPSVFKLRAIFEQMGYPVQTERLQEPGWSKRVLEKVERCLAPDSKVSENTNRILEDQTTRIDRAYAPLFQLAGHV